MMDKKIVWKRPDGSIAITTPVAPPLDGESESDYLDRIADHAKLNDPDLAQASRVADIDGEVHRSADRYFRNAWTWVTPEPVIDVDMVKAREIQKDNFRRLRAPLLQALDIAYIRADEAGDAKTKSDITADKVALRDVTDDPAIEAATTPEQLKAVLPEALR